MSSIRRYNQYVKEIAPGIYFYALNPSNLRTIDKMKATITQRFKIQGCVIDVE